MSLNDRSATPQVYKYYHYTSTSSGSSSSAGWIPGVIIASIGGAIILGVVVFLVVRCCLQRQREASASQQVEVLYPQPTPPYNGGDGMQPNMMPMMDNGIPMLPPSAPQPTITPLGMTDTNPFAPMPPNYAYGTPMGLPPPQYADDCGNGMYYSRGTEAQVAAAVPLQRSNGTLSSKSGTNVTYFRDQK